MKKIRLFLLGAVVIAIAAIATHAQFQTRLQAIVQRAPDASADTDAESQKLSGTVTDAAGQPVAGASVGYWHYAGNFLRPSAMELQGQTNTDAQGAFELNVSRGTGFLLARKPGLAAAWKMSGQPFNPAGETETKLVLTPPGTLAGTVVDESSQPVAHAEVFVTLAVIEVPAANGSRSMNMLSGEPARDCFSARTDAAGHFRIDNFPTNATAMLAVRSPGKALNEPPGSFTGINSLPWSAGQEDIKLAVEPAGGVEGKIICEATNLRLPSARVNLQPEIQRGFGFATPEPVSSSPDGSFHINDVASGSYSVRAVFGTNALADWVAEPVSISVEPGQTNRDVQLTAVRGGVLEVSVVGRNDGKPVPQVDVNAFRQGGGGGTASAPAVSGPDGIARLRLLPGDYQVNANDGAMFLAQASASVEAGQTNHVDIEVVGPRKASGIVRTPDGKPAVGVPVQIVGAFGSRASDIKTDSNGRFQLEWNQPQFGGPNNWSTCILVRDVEHNLAVAEDLDEDTGTLDLKLAPGLTLAGRVEAGGKPITNAIALLTVWAGNRGMGQQGLARTDTAGQYEIPALPPGRRYGVTVSAPGYGQHQMNNLDISAEPGRQELDPVELKPANLKLAGQVLDVDDNPVTGCNVSLFGPDQPNGNTSTDRDGRFNFERVCEGPVQLSANGQGSFGNVSAEGGDTNVVLRLGQNAGSAPGATPHKLKGVVADADGRPVAGAQIAVFPNFNGTHWFKSGTNGAFNLTWSLQPWQMQSGTMLLVVRDPARDLAVTEDLSEEVTNLDVQLKPALTLAGQIKGVGDVLLTNAQVSLSLRAGNTTSSFDQQPTRADAQGRFEIKCLPPDAQYTLSVSAKGYGQSQQPVESDIETNRLELAPFALIPADRVIAGQVLDENDKPVAGMNVQLNGQNQPAGSVTTDRQGRFRFQVCAGQISLFAFSPYGGGNAQATAEDGDTNIVMHVGQNPGFAPGTTRHRLKGIVSDANGRPVAGAQLAVFPSMTGTSWFKSGTNGAFSLTWSLQPFGNVAPLLVVRDPARDLAASEDLSEDVTNLEVKLKPALTVAGPVKGVGDAPLTNAQVGLWLRAGNTLSSLDEQPARVNAEGRYEIKCLPPEARYTVYASANGYGRSQQQVESDTETNRLELPPLVLKLADRVIAGQVLDANDKPVSGVNVQLNGTDQPSGNVTADSQGRFHFQVCEGRINLFANSPYGGGFAQATAEAGDTNIVMNLRSNPGMMRQPPARHASLKGSPLPDLTTVNLAADAAPDGKAVLLCLFDAAQRPSRHVINQLNDQAAALQQKNVSVLGVQAAIASDDVFNGWKTASPVSFPVGRVTEKSPKSRWASEAAALPWLILADANHRVIAEGFALDELDAQIQKLTP